MKRPIQLFVVVLAALVEPCVFAQQTPFQRLNSAVFDVSPPSVRIRGTPGQMTVQGTACRTLPTAETRRRIVDVAIQEWAFFGFTMVEPDEDEFDLPGFDWRSSRLSPDESARVASSIAGYWAVTPRAGGMVASQNRVWAGCASRRFFLLC